ncbi:hypothetical protein H7F37_04470 [Winogradskyella sp. PAMC22761]|nr:hypothetical protein H7F37_04470 [Winogradskyella sp. PAMC22761]
MKSIIKIITILIFTFSFFNCKAQSPILPLKKWSDEQENAYYKDLNNELNSFEGTWLYTDGNTSLKIVLEKRLMQFNGDYYTDLIVGEYQYIENGIEKINTLSDLNLNLGEEHNIFGNSLYSDCNYIPVDDCVDGEIRLYLAIYDTLNSLSSAIILHNRIINGQQALKANLWYNGGMITSHPDDPEPTEPTIGWQTENMVFIKQ